MASSVLYTAENEYPPAEIESFLQWYAYRHAPDILRLGFQSCATYRAVEGGFNLLGIYEIPGVEMFDTPGYKAMQPRDPYRAGIAARTVERMHTVYAQRSLHPVDAAGVPRLDADWISMLRFAADEATEREIEQWFGEGLGAQLVDLGARQFRIAHRDGERPGSVTRRPRCLIVGEWDRRPPAGAQIWAALTARFAGGVSAVDCYAGRRAYPWPDRPEAA